MHERCIKQPKRGSPLKCQHRLRCPLSCPQFGSEPDGIYFYFISSKSHALRIDKRFDFAVALCSAGSWGSGAVMKLVMQQTLPTRPLRRKPAPQQNTGFPNEMRVPASAEERERCGGCCLGLECGPRRDILRSLVASQPWPVFVSGYDQLCHHGLNPMV